MFEVKYIKFKSNNLVYIQIKEKDKIIIYINIG